jgi:hypothetical protein
LVWKGICIDWYKFLFVYANAYRRIALVYPAGALLARSLAVDRGLSDHLADPPSFPDYWFYTRSVGQACGGNTSFSVPGRKSHLTDRVFLSPAGLIYLQAQMQSHETWSAIT